MNKSLKPVCDEERSLKAALRKDQHDDETWEEIEKTLVYLEEVKYEYADTLYEIADGIDDMYKQMLVEMRVKNNSTTDPIQKSIVDMLVSEREVRGYGDVVKIKAYRLCGSTLRQNTDEG